LASIAPGPARRDPRSRSGSPQPIPWNAAGLRDGRQGTGLAKDAIAAGADLALPPEQRAFLYMPFQHTEDLEDQRRSVALYESLGNANNLDFAVRHHEVIARFGRFPHRNAILGRASTPEEIAFLQEPGSSF